MSRERLVWTGSRHGFGVLSEVGTPGLAASIHRRHKAQKKLVSLVVSMCLGLHVKSPLCRAARLRCLLAGAPVAPPQSLTLPRRWQSLRLTPPWGLMSALYRLVRHLRALTPGGGQCLLHCAATTTPFKRTPPEGISCLLIRIERVPLPSSKDRPGERPIMASQLPTFPRVLFTIIEPISLYVHPATSYATLTPWSSRQARD
jgi:hypothetical protein